MTVGTVEVWSRERNGGAVAQKAGFDTVVLGSPSKSYHLSKSSKRRRASLVGAWTKGLPGRSNHRPRTEVGEGLAHLRRSNQPRKAEESGRGRAKGCGGQRTGGQMACLSLAVLLGCSPFL